MGRADTFKLMDRAVLLLEKIANLDAGLEKELKLRVRHEMFLIIMFSYLVAIRPLDEPTSPRPAHKTFQSRQTREGAKD